MKPEQHGKFRRSRRAIRKEQILDLLARRDQDGLVSWIESVPNPASVLVSLLFVSDELLRWRAVETLGRLIGQRAKENPEMVRDYIRRLFWSMNDESGNLIRNAPEAIGEILANALDIAHEYIPQLLSFLHEEPFERGTHWAVARLASLRPEAFDAGSEALHSSIEDPDPAIRAYTMIAVTALGSDELREQIEAMADDPAVVRLYDFDSGELSDTTVGQIAQSVIDKIPEPAPASR